MLRYLLLAAIALTLLASCAPAASIGGSAAMSHTLNGIVYQTLTAPSAKVRTAAINALARMQIKLVSDKTIEDGKVRQVTAKTKERKIEIELEAISPNTTRMRVTAKSSPFFYDSATAEEIIAQTKKSLG